MSLKRVAAGPGYRQQGLLAGFRRSEMRSARLLGRPPGWEEVSFGEHEVGERIAIERLNEGAERFVQHVRQLAAPCDDAVIVGAEAFHKREVGLSGAHDGAEIDRLRRFRQSEAACASAYALEVTGSRQDVDHLHEMAADRPCA